MEYFGLFAFVICLWLISELENVKKMKRRLEILERKAADGTEAEKGEEMSRLIEELKGKWCIMDAEDLDVEKVRVCDTDGEWVKVEYQKKGIKASEQTIHKLIRISAIDSVEIM